MRKVIAKDAGIQSLLAETLASGALTSLQSAVADRGGRVTQGGRRSVKVSGDHTGNTTINNIGIPWRCKMG